MQWINFGVERVVLVGFGVILTIGALNLLLVLLDRPGFGLWVQAWARRYVVLAGLLAFFVGALVGHFYWATPPRCPSGGAQALAAAQYPNCPSLASHPYGH